MVAYDLIMYNFLAPTFFKDTCILNILPFCGVNWISNSGTDGSVIYMFNWILDMHEHVHTNQGYRSSGTYILMEPLSGGWPCMKWGQKPCTAP